MSGPPKTASTTPMEWIEASIQKHNEYRTLHGSVPLVYNNNLCEISQAYANHLAETFLFNHNPALADAELGENLYYKSSSIPFDVDPETAVSVWYDEIKDYDFETGYPVDEKKEVLHFTQLIWKGTTDIGVAYAKGVKPNGTNWIYVVANYSPRGNFDDFLENVVPKVKSSPTTTAAKNDVEIPNKDKGGRQERKWIWGMCSTM